jgi:2,3-dihydroxybenzoate decarboxylase
MTMQGKIALEEHFVAPGLDELISKIGWEPQDWERVHGRLLDVDRRLSEMDRLGIEKSVLSLGASGIQDIPDADRAVDLARRSNEALAEVVAAHPERFAGFAALPLQDPEAAAAELERCVRDYGFKGALVNGYTTLGAEALYYDDERFLGFWERVDALGVPFYLHPRNPQPDQRRVYDGRPELLGPTWAFAVETGTHALRLITSGLFDRFPALTVILGHLGEFLPFALPRLEQRMSHQPHVNLAKPATQYLRDNFYLTTSGNNHTASLVGILLELGADRLMFAADYPFEEMEDGAQWFDAVPISELDRLKIGRTNAQQLLGL